MNNIIITSPNLNTSRNVSGISAVTNFIISNNRKYNYHHFELGKSDNESRNIFWFIRIVYSWLLWGWKLLSQRKILIHFNVSLTMRSILRDFPLIIVAQLLRKKMILHIHGGEYLEDKNPPKWAGYILKKSFSKNNPIIVLGNSERELLSNRYGATNIHVIPNCVDLIDAKNYQDTESIRSPLKLIYIGRIDKNKGIDYILDALIMFKDKNETSFLFRMAGTGPDKDFYVPKFKSRLGTSFEYKGVVTGKEKTELLLESNIFLLPSLYEGLPISLLENMSFGNVPVVTDVGSIGSVVTDGINGIIVKRHSAEDIYAALNRLSNDYKLIKQLGDNARQHIFKHFDPENYFIHLNRIYEMG